MKKQQRPQQDELLDLLRRGDPAGEAPGLAADEIARMRCRIVSEPVSQSSFFFRPLPAFAASALLLLVVVVGWRVTRSELPPTLELTESVNVTDPAEIEIERLTDPAADERRIRQVQFSTPGGTRIIWLLDSEFEV